MNKDNKERKMNLSSIYNNNNIKQMGYSKRQIRNCWSVDGIKKRRMVFAVEQ